jgi:hypothetical protein
VFSILGRQGNAQRFLYHTKWVENLKNVVCGAADGGKIEKLDTDSKDGHLVWHRGHFSDFIIVYKGEVIPDIPVTPPTGDRTILPPWIIAIILTAGVIFFLVFRKNRKQEKEKTHE